VDPQAWNRYAYTENNPLRYVDPDGLDFKLASGLDITYPYGVGADGTPITSCTQNPATVNTTNPNLPCDTATDSPAFPLDIHLGERQGSFNATMYLEWIPLADTTCITKSNPGNNPCTIPAPLGSINWHWLGDAIDTLQPNPGTGYEFWVMNPNCSGGAPCSVAEQFQPFGSLSTWTKNVKN
jgi:hypothetical protein